MNILIPEIFWTSLTQLIHFVQYTMGSRKLAAEGAIVLMLESQRLIFALETEGLTLKFEQSFEFRTWDYTYHDLSIIPTFFRVPSFEEYYLSLHPGSERFERNKWLKELWRHKFNCEFNLPPGSTQNR